MERAKRFARPSIVVHEAPAPGSRTCSFGPIEVAYGDGVLVPRPWTIAQSEWAAELSGDLPDGPIVELCAGVGHIGLAAAVLTGRSLILVEADPVAAGFAVRNAATLGLADRVEMRAERLETAARPEESWPIILADPPYIPSGDIGRFPEDPQHAIDGGEDGLDLVRSCLAFAGRHLMPGCPLILQVAGPAQADQVIQAAIAVNQPDLEPEAVRTIDDERALVSLRRPVPRG